MVQATAKHATVHFAFIVLLFSASEGHKCRDEIDGCKFYLEDCEFMGSLCAKTCGSCTEIPGESDAKNSYSPHHEVDIDFYYDMQEGAYGGDPFLQYDEYGSSTSRPEATIRAPGRALDFEPVLKNPSSLQSDSEFTPGENLPYDIMDYKPLPHPSEAENISVENLPFDNVDYTVSPNSEDTTFFPTESSGAAENDNLNSNVQELDKLLEESREREEKELSRRTFDIGSTKIIGNLVQHLRSVEKDPDELTRKLDSVQKVITLYKRRDDPVFLEAVLNYFVGSDLNKPLDSATPEELMDALLTYHG